VNVGLGCRVADPNDDLFGLDLIWGGQYCIDAKVRLALEK